MRLGASNAFSTLLKDVVGDKELKTQAIVIAIEQVTGSKPIIDKSNPNVNVIRFTSTQAKAIENFISNKSKVITSGGKSTSVPPNVKIDTKALWLPLVLKKAIPYIIGFTALGYFLGKKF